MPRRLASMLLSLLFLAAPVPAQTTSPRARVDALLAAARNDPAQVVPSIEEGSSLLATTGGDAGRELADALEAACERAFFSPERVPGMEQLGLVVHTVEKGEVGSRIAQRYRIGPGLLAMQNQGFDERKLRVGQELKVLDLSDKSLQILVHKGLYRMTIWRSRPGGGPALLVACLPVGLGAPDSPTPEGKTKIAKRVLDPEWTHPVTHQVFAPRDPGNVLGGYWIALDPEGIGRSGIGFHGYTGEVAANWIEQPASHGCVRLLQPHVDRVFHLALEGTPVEIRP
jgi:lipoprotein-anchoring transpeptidase ErfK/SrfK